MNNKAIEQARSLYYKFFGITFDFINSEEQIDTLFELILQFSQNPMNENARNHLDSLQLFLTKGGLKALKNENDELFISPATSFIPMSVSYYDEGRDDGQKRVECVEYILCSKFRKNELKCKNSEDNLTFLFQFMQVLIQAGVKDDKESLELSTKIFTNILNDYLDEFINSILTHESGIFYKDVAGLLKIFVDFERFYLEVKVPKQKIVKERVGLAIQRDRKPLVQRVKRDLNEIKL